MKNKIKKCTFITEFGDLLESTVTLPGKLVVLRDSNVHMDSSSDPEAQLIHGATHINGHTLDLVLSRTGIPLTEELGVVVKSSDDLLTSIRWLLRGYGPAGPEPADFITQQLDGACFQGRRYTWREIRTEARKGIRRLQTP
jgi:hypothetical protein